MKCIVLIALVLYLAVNFAFANVPPPLSTRVLGIELQADYPDYVFYFCYLNRKVKDGIWVANNRVERIDLTLKKPFTIKRPSPYPDSPESSEGIFRADFLFAVKQDIYAKFKGDLEKRLLKIAELANDPSLLYDTAQNEKLGIYYSALPRYADKCSGDLPCLGPYEFVVRVERLNETGLKFKGYDKTGFPEINQSETPKTPLPPNKTTCFGLFLSVTFTFGVILFSRKRKRGE